MDYKLKENIFYTFIYHLKMVFIPFEGNKFSPQFLASRALLYFIILLFVIKIFSVALFFNIPKNIFFAEISRSVLIQETNQERTSLGLNILRESDKLNDAALLKAQDMVKNQYFAHQSPQGKTPWYWFRAIGYTYKYAGENLAIGFFDSDEVYQAWLSSPSHKANLLNPNYKEIGMAVLNGYFDGNITTVVVQLFGNPQTVSAVSVVKKASVPSVPISGVKPKVAPVVAPVIEKSSKDLSRSSVIVLGESIESPTLRALDQVKNDSFWSSKIIYFILYAQDKILETVAYVFLLLIVGILIVDYNLNFDKQNLNYRFRALSYIFILCLITFIDRNIVMQIFPHVLII